MDSVTLLAALQQAGTLDALGGAPYITELSLFVPSAANVSHYIHIVSERSVLRQLMEAGATIPSGCFTQNALRRCRAAYVSW